MKKIIALWAAVVVYNVPAFAYNVDSNQISTSGISAGAYMAGQLHVAHSSTVMGAGLIAGGPYYCAQGNLTTALMSCMGGLMGSPSADNLASIAKKLVSDGQIDDVRHLQKSNIFVLSGQNDRVVGKPVVHAGISFYEKLGVPAAQIKVVEDLQVGHAFPTENYGNSCSAAQSAPYISNCNYDGAGEILKQIYGQLKTKVAAKPENIIEFSQAEYTEASPSSLSMGDKAYAYVPTTCKAKEKCRLHVAFHGCAQSIADIQDKFYTKTGYNEWAEANNIIVIYPQVVRDYLKGNNNACWDWWGYTGSNFHTKNGPQIKAVYNMIQGFSQIK